MRPGSTCEILRGSAVQPFIGGRVLAGAMPLPGGGELVTTARPSAAMLLSAGLVTHPVAGFNLDRIASYDRGAGPTTIGKPTRKTSFASFPPDRRKGPSKPRWR